VYVLEVDLSVAGRVLSFEVVDMLVRWVSRLDDADWDEFCSGLNGGEPFTAFVELGDRLSRGDSGWVFASEESGCLFSCGRSCWIHSGGESCRMS
jgi:hypothetical protein